MREKEKDTDTNEKRKERQIQKQQDRQTDIVRTTKDTEEELIQGVNPLKL